MNLTDEMLRSAAADVRNAMLDSLATTEEPDHIFSPQFERKMRRLIHRQKPHYRLLQKIAAVLLALVVISGGWLVVDAKASAAFRQWVQNVYENSIVYQFFGKGKEEPEMANYRPAWLPEGYVEANITIFDSQVLIEYRNLNNESLYFHYMDMNEYILAEIDTEDMAAPIEITVNGMQGMFYQAIGSEQSNNLVWFDTEHNIYFSLSAYMEKSIMLCIAESVSLANVTN